MLSIRALGIAARGIQKQQQRGFSAFKAAPSTLPTAKLNSGYEKEMPMIGIGTFTGTRFNASKPPGVMKDTVAKWLKSGGRMVDCAQNYLNEAEIGDALTDAFENGLTREEVWVSSKLNNPYHREDKVRPALEKTLLDLNLDYLDSYLMHWPTAFVPVPFEDGDIENRGLSMEYEPDQCSKVTGVMWEESKKGEWPPPHLDMGVTIHETWAAMVELQKAGLVKNIGICNIQVQLLHELLCGTDTKPQVVQHESHPYCQQLGLLQYCKMNDIQFQAYSPLGYGEFVGKGEVRVLENPVLQKIAEKHGRGTSPGGVAAVCLAWQVVHRGVGTTPLTFNVNEMEANLTTGTLTLDESDLAEIRTLDKNHHYLRPEDWYGLPYWD